MGFDKYFSFLVLNVIVDRGYYIISLQHVSVNGTKGA